MQHKSNGVNSERIIHDDGDIVLGQQSREGEENIHQYITTRHPFILPSFRWRHRSPILKKETLSLANKSRHTGNMKTPHFHYSRFLAAQNKKNFATTGGISKYITPYKLLT